MITAVFAVAVAVLIIAIMNRLDNRRSALAMNILLREMIALNSKHVDVTGYLHQRNHDILNGQEIIVNQAATIQLKLGIPLTERVHQRLGTDAPPAESPK